MKKFAQTKNKHHVAFILFFLISLISIAQTSRVALDINWPFNSGQNYVLIYNPAGLELGRYCNPTNCYNGSNTSYSTTIDLGCLPDGNNYRVRLFDRFNNGWGSSSVTVNSGGNPILTSTIGAGQSGSSFFFNVSGGGCASVPEIDVTGNGLSISNNDITPNTADFTDLGTADGTSTISKTFTIENTGTGALTLTGTPINIVGINAADFTITSQPISSIAPGSSSDFTVAFSRNLLGSSNATIEFSSNDTDESIYRFNITASSVNPLSTLYYENFDAGAGGWTSTSINGFEFSLGTVFNEKGEGDYWYTDNWNNFPSNARATVTSPIISTLGYTDLKFWIDFRTNTNDPDDGMRVQYSINGGITWSTLGTNASGENWYNSGDVDGFANNADGWTGDNSNLNTSLSRFEEASHNLPNIAANNPNFRMRVAFASDFYNSDDGVLFDNIIITGRKIIPDIASNGPADVKDDLTLWLRSQDIVSTDGSLLPLWEDRALDNDAFEVPASAPVFANNVTNNINFNSTVAFDRSQQQHLRGKGGFNSNDYWIVVRSSIDMTTALAGETMLLGAKFASVNPAKDPSGLGWGPVSARYDDEVIAHSVGTVSENNPADGSYGRALSDATATFDDVHILNVKNNPANDQTEIYLNGRRVDNQTGVTQVTRETLNFSGFTNKPFYLAVGRYQLNGLPFETHLNGEITEVFSYRDRKSELVQQKIYSYLAIKNGVSLHKPNSTLNHHRADWDYLDSDNNIVWNYGSNTQFNYDVAALARDDKSELLQKQSKSENSTSIIAIGLDKVEDLGSQNLELFENDKDFLFWGHNGQDLNTYSAVINHDLGTANSVSTSLTRINRIWKIEEKTSTDIATTEVRVATSDFSGLPALTTNREYVLIIADDANFTTNLETRFFYNDGAYERASYNFDGIKYFTLGITDVKFEDRSISFDGVDDHMIIDNPQGLGSNFSTSAWVLSTGLNSTNTERTIVAKRTNGSGFQLSLKNDNRISLRWNGSTLQEMVSNTALSDGIWRHVGFSYDGTTAKIYIDGVLDIQQAFTNPLADSNLLGIGARIDEDETTHDHFKGEIDEIRMWDIALTQTQIRFIMNQELQENSNFVAGKTIPSTITKNDMSGINWNSLTAYYSMNSFIGTALNDQSVNKGYARMANDNYFELKNQTAPLPYISDANGDWENTSSWENGSLLYTPGSTRIINGVVEKINWNIVKTKDEVNITNTDITLLGLFVESNEMNVDNDHGLTITHVLDLQGSIDLKGESQLVQIADSDLLDSITGFIERDQQGTGITYDYNYWSSPVSIKNINSNNNGFTLDDVLKDGTLANNPRDLNWTGTGVRDGTPGNALTAATISGRWLYKYSNLVSDTYSNWQYAGPNGSMNTGEGWTMKGTGSITEQNYVFVGKPNNGDIDLAINAGNDYLIGNPYPSALDTHEFISDNPNLDGTLYFWEHWGGNTHILSSYQGGYAMYNYSGGVVNATIGTSNPDVNQGGIPTKRPERFVPVAQGFFVTGITDGTIKFRNDQRNFVTEASGSSLFVAAPGASHTGNSTHNDYNNINDLRPKIRLGFDSPNTIHRQLLLTVDSNASMNYDNAFDGVQIDEQIDDMAFILGNQNLTIQGINAIDPLTELPLMVKLDGAGSITIKLDEIKNVESTQKIYLKDAVQNTYTDLMNGDYNSPSLAAGINSTRYSIVFSDPVTLGSEDAILQENDLIVYTPNDAETLHVKKGQEILVETLTLTNMLGQQVKTWDVTNQESVITVNIGDLASGNYIIVLDTNYGLQSRKVIIK
ncbi:LamG-like jellyroll fold domain-containing protein [uncultured Nonlabens sp.]|uniref:LamG-like jellyroll fold domain-containing protein n=1 Tax=uncultured Nonlabens sp. TaxID=859306 RepID=UPI00262A1613|nr:LamG-like jellyroll fold domain-containing protein [uncultured Nonlabens sp.]